MHAVKNQNRDYNGIGRPPPASRCDYRNRDRVPVRPYNGPTVRCPAVCGARGHEQACIIDATILSDHAKQNLKQFITSFILYV